MSHIKLKPFILYKSNKGFKVYKCFDFMTDERISVNA